MSDDVAERYAGVDERAAVLAMLRTDYPRNPTVRAAVHAAVSSIVFLDRTDVPFEALGIRNPPRGLRWWWTALTGEDLDAREPPGDSASPRSQQLSLDELHEGYGG